MDVLAKAELQSLYIVSTRDAGECCAWIKRSSGPSGSITLCNGFERGLSEVWRKMIGSSENANFDLRPRLASISNLRPEV